MLTSAQFTPITLAALFERTSKLAAFTPIEVVYLIPDGLANYVYYVVTATGQDLIVKYRANHIRTAPTIPRHQWKIIDEVRAACLLARLPSLNIVPKLIYFDRHVPITIWSAVGRGPSSAPLKFADCEIARSVASSLSTFHRTTAPLVRSGLTVRPLARERHFGIQQLQWLALDLPLRSKALSRYRAAACTFVANNPTCLIWGDLTPKNIVFASDRALFVDLETVHMSNHWFDVGWYLGHALLDGLLASELALAVTFASEFLDVYRANVSTSCLDALDDEGLVYAFSGCALLYRVLASFRPLSQTEHRDRTPEIIDLGEELLGGGRLF